MITLFSIISPSKSASPLQIHCDKSHKGHSKYDVKPYNCALLRHETFTYFIFIRSKDPQHETGIIPVPPGKRWDRILHHLLQIRTGRPNAVGNVASVVCVPPEHHPRLQAVHQVLSGLPRQAVPSLAELHAPLGQRDGIWFGADLVGYPVHREVLQ